MKEDHVPGGRDGFAVRLSAVERKILEAAAALRGERMGAFMRRAAMSVAHRELGRAPSERR